VTIIAMDRGRSISQGSVERIARVDPVEGDAAMIRRCMLILGAVGVWAALGAQPAHAQLFGFFKKSPPPPPPAQRVGELVTIVRTDGDERKRTAAVEELRNFDTKAFPEIVPVLAEAAVKGTKPGVRAEAINSLVRIRPISNIAGQAIEAASQHDDYWRNRMSAQTALVRYRMAGYTSPTPPPPAPPQNAKGSATPTPPIKVPPQTGEPPLADAVPPIVYYDQNGKQIAPPKEIGIVTQAPSVPALPTGNPRTAPPPITTIPSPYAPPPPYSPPLPYAPPVPLPTFTAPMPPAVAPPPVTAPPVTAPPPVFAPPAVAPPSVTPTLREPEATEPTFRPLNKISPDDRLNSANPPRSTTPGAGPALDLPPLPTAPPGPSLDFTLPMPTAPLTPLPTTPAAAPAPLTPQPAPTSGPAPF
jgi:HEAT repeats